MGITSDDKIRRINALASRLKDWLENGVPTACKRPPWWRILQQKDAAKVKNIFDKRRE